MRRKSNSQAEAPGQDSFLDVVANLVGILIILVMIVSAHAKSAMIAEETSTTNPRTPVGPSPDLAAAEAAAADVEKNMAELEGKIQRQALEVAFRQEERGQLQTIVALAEQELAKSRDAMTEEDRAQYDLAQDLIQSKGELERLGQTITSVVKPSKTVLQHLPTPMAKTVFGHEMHFRLLGGRLAYVPMNEMTDALQKDAPTKVQKLRSQPRIEESLPVRDGFGARYSLRREGDRVAFEEIYMVDAEENLGEPANQALQPNSLFRGRLNGHDPKRTTVTVWVYPDSFDEFRQLKGELFKLGFLTAARPLPFGVPIAASPDGNRSTAE
ncbi:MAG: hypothetical protein ACKVP0_18755 [Pirellulaceae bacterium]